MFVFLFFMYSIPQTFVIAHSKFNFKFTDFALLQNAIGRFSFLRSIFELFQLRFHVATEIRNESSTFLQIIQCKRSSACVCEISNHESTEFCTCLRTSES